MSRRAPLQLDLFAADGPQLEEGYYVRNFETLISTVRRRYEDLLSAEELDFAGRFEGLPEAAKRLYVRLISRRGPCFRRDRLDYPEIPDLDVAIDELTDTAFLDGGHDEDPATLLSLLRRPELLELGDEIELDQTPLSSLRKAELLERIAEHHDPEILRRDLRRRFRILRPLDTEIVLTYRLLFFGNLSQDLHEFVLADLGLWRYEPYELRQDLRLFGERAALDDTLRLLAAKRQLRSHLDAGEESEALELACSLLARAGSWHPSTRPLFDRLLNRMGRHLERRQDWEGALTFYSAATRPPARERRARILDRVGAPQLALELVEEIAERPRDETEAAFAPRFGHRLRRRQGLPSEHRRPKRPLREISLPCSEEENVESLALEALEASGQRGFFSENWLWRSLFGLAFWDVVFAPVPGAFQHPFQSGPLDLYSPEFRRARAELVDRRLEEVSAETTLMRRLMPVYTAKRAIRNRLVAWNEELLPFLQLAFDTLAGEHLRIVCDRLSRDLGRYRRGFPDLFVLRDEAPGFELLEVKAPGDQLRPEQGAWIDYLNAKGIPATVLKVTWTDS